MGLISGLVDAVERGAAEVVIVDEIVECVLETIEAILVDEEEEEEDEEDEDDEDDEEGHPSGYT